MARGNVNKGMISSAENLVIQEIAAATVFNSDVNYKNPINKKTVIEIVTDLDPSKVNELYTIEEFKNKKLLLKYV